MEEVGTDSRYMLLPDHLLPDHSAQFTLTKKNSWMKVSQAHWSISNVGGNLVFRTKSLSRYSHQRFRLLDATGNQVVYFEQERHGDCRTWNVFCGSSEVVHFSLRMFETSTSMNVYLPSNSDTQNPDYKIQRPESLSSKYNILHGTEEVAVVREHERLGFELNVLRVVVFPRTDHVFILMLIIITETMVWPNWSNSGSGGASATAAADAANAAAIAAKAAVAAANAAAIAAKAAVAAANAVIAAVNAITPANGVAVAASGTAGAATASNGAAGGSGGELAKHQPTLQMYHV